jgi:hypothetical protein
LRLSVPPYPFLAAVYPVVALAAANPDERIRPAELVMPLGVSLVVAVAVWLLTRLVCADRERRALIALAAVVAFASYGYVREVLLSQPRLQLLGAHAVTLPAAVILMGAAAWSARRAARPPARFGRYLNLVFLLLLAGSVASYARSTRTLHATIATPNPTPMPAAHDRVRPHFFLIAVDKYTGSESLRANYGYDNGPFERSLESLGFVVPQGARANYVHTFLALAALLNWNYLTDAAESLKVAHATRGPMYARIEDNPTWRTLKTFGYEFVVVPSAFALTAGNRFADRRVQHPRDVPRAFETVWLRTTMLYPLVEGWCAQAHCFRALLPHTPESAASFDWKFDALGRLAESDAPLFVFAHLALPHEPYIYASDCSHVPPYWPSRDDGAEEGKVKAAYVAQLQCVNRKLLGLVQTIARAPHPAIVAIQSDHGHGRLGLFIPEPTAVRPDQVAERLDIFAAYRLPGAPKGLIADSMGPVNAMRAIMRHYFGRDLPRLADSSWWSSGEHPYCLIPMR